MIRMRQPGLRAWAGSGNGPGGNARARFSVFRA